MCYRTSSLGVLLKGGLDWKTERKTEWKTELKNGMENGKVSNPY